MKRLVLSILTLSMLIFQGANAQNGGACNQFADETGLSEWDPNNKLSYSVSNGELTLTFTAADFWGQNEMKWDFPSAINISGSASTNISFDVAVTSVTINGGSGAGCATVNYLPLGISLYDGTNYSSGVASNGFYNSEFVAGSVDVIPSPANSSAITGIAIKPASFNDGASPCNTEGSGTVTATIKIKNLKVGNAVCGTPTNIARGNTIISKSIIFPNPATESTTISLNLINSSYVKVILSDLTGREIETIAEGNYTELNKEIDTKKYNAGTYTVSYIINGSFAKSELLLLR